MTSPQLPSNSPALVGMKRTLLALLDDVLAHDGYGSIRVDVRLLKRGQKEVILDCGKQYRFVVDQPESVPVTGMSDRT
jgi:hypothetical protein